MVSAFASGASAPGVALTAEEASDLPVIELFEDLQGSVELDLFGVVALDLAHLIGVRKRLLGRLMVKNIHLCRTL